MLSAYVLLQAYFVSLKIMKDPRERVNNFNLNVTTPRNLSATAVFDSHRRFRLNEPSDEIRVISEASLIVS
jgi:hypothetical protein